MMRTTYRYPGSRPFQDTPADRRLFFGRAEETHELLHLTLAERLVVVFAASGLGKSSLINAGILQPLRQRDFFPMAVRVNDPDCGPLFTLYKDVEEAVHQGGIEILTVPGGRLETEYGLSCQGGPMAKGELSRHCHERRVPLWLFFKETEFWRGDVLCDPVLVMDQFEELFTLQTAENREELIDELANLVRDRMPSSGELKGPALKILLSLREDWLGSLEELVPKIPGILSTRFRLEPLRKDQAREAIEQPASMEAEDLDARTFTYAPEAVEAILEFLSRRRLRGEMVPTDEVSPSQLQLICSHLEGLVHEGGHGPAITLDDLGGHKEKVPEVLSGVLQQYYDEQTTKVASGLRLAAVRRLCETGLVVNGRRASSDGAMLTQSFGVTAGELRALTDCHLLRAVPRLDSVYYELAHDTLVQPILASRGRRRRRLNRVFAWGLAVVLLVAGAFGAQRAYAKHVQEKTHQIFEELARTEGSLGPAAFLASAVDSVHRAGCVTSSREPACLEIEQVLRRAVEAGREIGAAAAGPTARLPAKAAKAIVELPSGVREARAESNRLTIRDAREGEDEIRVPFCKLTDVAVAPSGRRIVTAGQDGTLRLWRRGGGSLVPLTRPWQAHDREITAAAFDPSGERLLTSGREGGLRLWSREGRELSHPALGEERIRDLRVNVLAWAPDGVSFAIGGSDGSVRVWDESGWTAFDGHAKGVRAVAFAPDGRRLASAGDDSTLRLWDLDGADHRKLLTRDEGNELKALAWSPDGGWIATGGTDKTVLLWDAASGEHHTLGSHDGGVLAVAYHPGGRYLASGGRDGMVRIWDPSSGASLATLPDYKRYVNSVAFAADGTLVGGSYGGSVKVLPAAAREPRGELVSPAVETYEVSQSDLTAAALSGDGRYLASGSSDGTVRLRKWDDGDGFKRVITPIRDGLGRVEAVAFDDRGRRFGAATAKDGFRIWDLDGQKLFAFPSPEAEIEALAFSADGATLASRDARGTRFWDVSGAAPEAPLELVAMACRRLESLRGSRPHRDLVADFAASVWDACGHS